MAKKKITPALLESLQQIEQLFEFLPDVFFFVKNQSGEFVMANQVFIEKCGEVDVEAIVGKNDYDFFPKDRADLYVLDDKQVMKTGKPIVNRVELAPERDIILNFFVTSKIPLRNNKGEIIGLAGIARDLGKTKQNLKPFAEMAEVVDYIHQNCTERIEIPKLAKIAAMSMSQFERRFKELFNLTPQQYTIEIRLHKACEKIIATDQTFSQIAHDCGFYDHSHFTRQFVKQFGITPKEYRHRHY